MHPDDPLRLGSDRGESCDADGGGVGSQDGLGAGALPDFWLAPVLIFVFYAISFALNTLVIRTLGLSVVYAVWSGVGTVLTALIGYLAFT